MVEILKKISNGFGGHVNGISKTAHKSTDPQAMLDKLTLEQKITLLSGADHWHTAAIPSLGIPKVRTSDGPNGVRGTIFVNGTGASCTPCATGLGASFDKNLLLRVGEMLGSECRERGVHCLLGPTTNIQRHPCGGRGFESYAEDPYLAGMLALRWIEGVQSQKVMVSPKHYVANEQEYYRRSNDSVMDERTLHELYLEPFRIQCQAKPSTFMTSYNRVNGLHAAEHTRLLRDVLRRDFGFDGMLMSDWSGTASTAEAIKASLDLEMPGPSLMRGSALERCIMTGKVTEADLDDCVLRVLKFVQEAKASGIPFDLKEEVEPTSQETKDLLRECATAAVVLLKNDNDILPIKPHRGMKIAVIGPHAKPAFISGGGSANLVPSYSVSPLAGIEEAAAASGASVHYCEGTPSERWMPLLSPYLHREGGEIGVDIAFYSENPWSDSAADVLFELHPPSSHCYFLDGVPARVPVRGYIAMKASFVPDESGIWEVGLGAAGQADLYIDGSLLIENSKNQKPGLQFFSSGAEERLGYLEVEAGRSYDVEVRFSNFKQLSAASPYAGRRGGIRLGGRKQRSGADEIQKAVDLAASSDVTVVVVGNNNEWESEGYDRSDMKLPLKQDLLVESILKVSPDAVIVHQSGMPNEMPWSGQARALLQAFYGGNESGHAIADILFGAACPSGKLPITFPRAQIDCPSDKNFGNIERNVYAEGMNIGYRYFDRPPSNPSSAFAFGYGLSYTRFRISDLRIETAQDGFCSVTFNLANVGQVAGQEVAQIYVHPTTSQVERPAIELKGFKKVLLQPGTSDTVTCALNHTAFSYYNVQSSSWQADAGCYEIRVGRSSLLADVSAPFHLAHSYRWVGQSKPQRLL